MWGPEQTSYILLITPSQNSVSVWASGSAEEIEVQMIEAVAGAGVASTSWVREPTLFSDNGDTAVTSSGPRNTNGVRFRAIRECRVIGLKYYIGEDDSDQTYKICLYRRGTPTLLRSIEVAGPSAAGIVETLFDSPLHYSGK